MANNDVTARLGTTITYSDDFLPMAREVVEYERAGLDVVGVAEAYSFDAVSRLGYLAAITSTVGLASSILPIYTRSPSVLGMTAAGLDELSGGRFELGIGPSGGQVIEGFHGIPYQAPLGHLRETVEICRALWRREAVQYDGKYYQLPLPAEKGKGLGKPLKLVNHPVRDAIPINIAALTHLAVAQAAEIGSGWIPIFYYPERVKDAWGTALEEGLAKRDPALGSLDIQVSVPLFIGDHTDQAIAGYRDQVALYVGGMGARGANFYNDLATRYGFADEAASVQELYLTGRKEEAAAAVPDELVLSTSLIGSESQVKERIDALLASGVTTISVTPLGPTPAHRIQQIEAVRALLPKRP